MPDACVRLGHSPVTGAPIKMAMPGTRAGKTDTRLAPMSCAALVKVIVATTAARTPCTTTCATRLGQGSAARRSNVSVAMKSGTKTTPDKMETAAVAAMGSLRQRLASTVKRPHELPAMKNRMSPRKAWLPPWNSAGPATSDSPARMMTMPTRCAARMVSPSTKAPRTRPETMRPDGWNTAPWASGAK